MAEYRALADGQNHRQLPLSSSTKQRQFGAHRRSRRLRLWIATSASVTRSQMGLEIQEEPLSALDDHAMIPIAFRVERVLDVSALKDGLGGLALAERPVEASYEKDYDALKGEGPTRWPKRFDVSNWGLIAAHLDSERVGGAVIAFNTANVDMLEQRDDLAVLWDLRVRATERSQGVGSRLFEAAADWARTRGCRELRVETQNINVPACRFYARMGCTLGSIDRFAYPELPEETRLVWFKDLDTAL
jgi:GNAT superfamily N-acetyltransferase